MLASEVMDRVAVLLNDRARTTWTYEVLLPYLQIAWDELLIELENNHLKVTREVSNLINVAAGATTVTLPNNLVELISVKERTQGSSENFTDLEEADWPLLNYTSNTTLGYYNWNGETLTVPAATTNRELKLRYVKSLSPISAENSIITLFNSKPYLSYKTAALAADHSGRAPEFATRLEQRAAIALHKMISIKVGAMQSQPVRRGKWR
jgi:hypothetical protein